MNKELTKIKSWVINQVSLITALMLTPAWIFSVLRIFEIGWKIIFLLHTFIYFSTVIIFFFRRKLTTEFKIISLVILYALVAFSALKAFGFSSAHYYSIVALAILSLLQKRKYIVTFLVVFIILYLLIAIGYSSNNLKAIVDLDMFSHMPLQWINLIITVFSLSMIFIYAFGSFHSQLLEIIKKKTQVEKKLEEQKDSLEKLVDSRTQELRQVNEELLMSNQRLKNKKDLIEKQNKYLEDTIEKLKDAHQRMIQSEKMASIGVLTSGIAHEINNPLNFIMGSYESLFDSMERNECLKDDTRQYLEYIKSGVERITDILQGLNAFNRSNKSVFQSYNVNEVLDNCIRIFNYRIHSSVEIKKEYSNNLPELQGEIGGIHQVFTNILSNALDAIEKGGTIKIKTKQKKNGIEINISDSGCGIPAKIIHRITEPFFTTKPPGKGTGLGLSISYNIVFEHNGELLINSEENKGTSVSVFLPFSNMEYKNEESWKHMISEFK